MNTPNSESDSTGSSLSGNYTCTVFNQPVVARSRGELQRNAQAVLDACTDPEARSGRTYRFPVKKNGGAGTDLVLVKAKKRPTME